MGRISARYQRIIVRLASYCNRIENFYYSMWRNQYCTWAQTFMLNWITLEMCKSENTASQDWP